MTDGKRTATGGRYKIKKGSNRKRRKLIMRVNVRGEMMIDYEKLTAQQALEIAQMKLKIQNYVEAFKEIHCALYCIGAPLNDNKLEFNEKQKVYLHRRIALSIPFEDSYYD